MPTVMAYGTPLPHNIPVDLKIEVNKYTGWGTCPQLPSQIMLLKRSLTKYIY